MHYCLNCLNAFNSEEKRDEHFTYCSNHDSVKVEMPKENEKWLYYKDGYKQLKVPFSIACDFECIINKDGKHIPCGYSAVLRCAFGDVSEPFNVYRGKDCVENFIQYINDKVRRLYLMFPQKQCFR